MAWDNQEEDEDRLPGADRRAGDNDVLRGWLMRAGVPGYATGYAPGNAPMPSASAPSPDMYRSESSPVAPSFGRQYLNMSPGQSDLPDAAQRDVDRYRVPLDASDPRFRPGFRGYIRGMLAGAAAGAGGRDPLAAGDRAAHRNYYRAESQRQRNLVAAEQRRQQLVENELLNAGPQPDQGSPQRELKASQPGEPGFERGNPAAAAQPLWNFESDQAAGPPPPPNPPGSSPAPVARAADAALAASQEGIRTRSGQHVRVGDAVRVGGRTMFVTGVNHRTGRPTVSSIRPK